MALFDKLLLLLHICFINVDSYKYIPVYMWETSENYYPLPALKLINEYSFREIMLHKYNKWNNIILFLEETLSPEDFIALDSTGHNVFTALSQLKSHVHVNYYPFVETPLKVLQNLPGVEIQKIGFTINGMSRDFKIEPKKIIIIDLNDNKEHENRSTMLQRHDSLIHSIYRSVLSKNKKIIALYTARNSQLIASKLNNNGLYPKIRKLLQTSDDKQSKNAVIGKTSNTLFYASDTIVLSNDKDKYELKKITSTSDGDITKLEGDGNLNIHLTFIDDFGYWFLPSIEAIAGGKTYQFKESELYAPYGFSYHCNNIVLRNATDKASLTIPGFQVQRFNKEVKEMQFGDAYDCIGFITPTILSGLFVIFILGIIISIGFCMIIDVKTMDRFDNPKAKTISVNFGE